jgi:hypothetical protein
MQPTAFGQAIAPKPVLKKATRQFCLRLRVAFLYIPVNPANAVFKSNLAGTPAA